MAADDRFLQALGDVTTALRELPLRIDRVIEGRDARLGAFFESRDERLGAFLESLADGMRAEAHESTARARAAEGAAREAREESRAVVEGLLRVIDRLDRLDPGSGPATA